MADKKAHPKNQHYVPQFLLRNFSTGKKKRVYVYDKLKHKTFLTSTRNIASENNFYDIDIDEINFSLEPLMTEVEGKASKIFKSIIRDQSLKGLTSESRKTVSLFAGTQFLRVVGIRHSLKNTDTALRNEISKRDLNPDDFLPPLDDNKTKLISLSMLAKSDEISHHLFNKSWILQKAPQSLSLYISDNPITLHNEIEEIGRGNLGLVSPGVEIYLPISKQFAICFLCESWIEKFNTAYIYNRDDNIRELITAVKTGDAKHIQPENVIFLNSLQVINSSRFIYSAVNNFELVSSMIAKNPKLKYPPKPIVE